MEIIKLDKEKCKCIGEETGAQKIVQEIKQYQEKWLQHLQRMDTNIIPVSWYFHERQRSTDGHLWTRTPALRWTWTCDPKYNRQQKQNFHLEGQHNAMLYSKFTLSCKFSGCRTFITKDSVSLDCCLGTVSKYILLRICLLFYQPPILFDCEQGKSISPHCTNSFLAIKHVIR